MARDCCKLHTTGMCVGGGDGGKGQGGLAIHCIVAGRYDNANYNSR